MRFCVLMEKSIFHCAFGTCTWQINMQTTYSDIYEKERTKSSTLSWKIDKWDWKHSALVASSKVGTIDVSSYAEVSRSFRYEQACPSFIIRFHFRIETVFSSRVRNLRKFL